MINTTTTEETQSLIDAGAQMVEVLPEPEFKDQHIAGAISLPLTELSRSAADEKLNRDRPVIVYCFDTQ